MTALDAPPLERTPSDEQHGDRTDGPERGTTTIAPEVFEKLAARAATEVPGVEGEVRTGLSRLLPWTSGTPAGASAEVDDDTVVLELTFNVAYPEPVRQIAEAVRRHVAEQVRSMTGRVVRQINITVPELVVPVRRPARVR
ncbi:MAG: Asp23/Gls24 family envelope stress response protein [Actinomycetota bacterium]